MIKVSDISVYLKCPRMSYFMSRGHDLVKEVTPGYLENILLKELALTYGSTFDEDDKLSFLNLELDRITEEIRIIYRSELDGIDDDTLAGSVLQLRSFLEDICLNLSDNDGFYANRSVLVEPLLQSEKLGLTGTPDKLIKINGELIPSIIKTGSMPDNGVWKSDRLQLTAYAVLVEEIYDTSVEHGFVEYARSGYVREVKIRRHERRKILQIRDRIKNIHKGFMPERPDDAPCSYCGFNEMCEVKSTLASRFF